MPYTMLKKLEKFESGLMKKGVCKEGPITTVSGLAGSGKSSVVKMLKEAFPGFKVVHSGQIFRENAERKGISLEEYCETRTNEDDISTDKETMGQALEGNAIVDSRIAGWVLGGWADIRVFVGCPLEERARRVAKREGIGYDEALERLERRDKADAARYKKLYGIDINDMKIYHMVIDNSGPIEELRQKAKDIAGDVKSFSS